MYGQIDVLGKCQHLPVIVGQLTPNNDIDKLQQAAKDDEPGVRIAAARSLYWAGRKKDAVGLLKKELSRTSAQDEELHFALDVLKSIVTTMMKAIATPMVVYTNGMKQCNM